MCHCEERSDAAIPEGFRTVWGIATPLRPQARAERNRRFAAALSAEQSADWFEMTLCFLQNIFTLAGLQIPPDGGHAPQVSNDLGNDGEDMIHFLIGVVLA